MAPAVSLAGEQRTCKELGMYVFIAWLKKSIEWKGNNWFSHFM
jgi:hypothetical protein